MRPALAAYRKRLSQAWPRLVVALVSLYGIYYAANIILTTSGRIQAIGLFTTRELFVLVKNTFLQTTEKPGFTGYVLK
jgi:hypothetical protein